VALAFPLGMVALLLSRWMWRQWLNAARRGGGWRSRVVAVGGADHVRSLISELERATFAGYHVVGVCVPPGGAEGSDRFGNVPVVGGLHDVAAAVQRVGAEAVVVTAAPAFGPTSLRRIAWALEGSGVELIVAPSLIDIAGPRIHSRPVAGLPLLHVEAPQYEGPLRLVKDVFERLFALLGIVLLFPFFLVIAALIKITSKGPVIYRQERVGKGGTSFQMAKFRSMVVDADELLERLAPANNGNGVLFKLREDPRVTRIGRWLRRYSVDELPQLLNVVRGEMSLVGPRPPLPTEVAQYGEDVRRRLLVKPGMTGLWQVSGRSDLSWEDSVRLDLYYVENWSLTQDLMILWKTARAVFGGGGAY
jgi:exopolysaccharide biosynthesis polyprenyl glycosylphosphotransferase